jgi:hypothetical protein
MEDKNIMTLRNRINQLEFYIKRNLEPTIMSLYMDIDRLNKKVKAMSSDSDNANDHEILNEGANSNPQMNLDGNGQMGSNTLENAIQTMEMLKQRTRRITPVQNRSGNTQIINQMQQKPQLPVGQSGRVIDN